MSGESLLRRLHDGPPLLLDGAMGTELARRGVDTSTPLWSAQALLDAPATVAQVHRDYLAAGAELHTACTFRTHPGAVTAAGEPAPFQVLARQAVVLARQALRDAAQPVWLLGSLAPVADCYRPQDVPDDATLRDVHTRHARALAAAGVDGFVVETMNTAREAAAATAAARPLDRPVLTSVITRRDGRLLGGDSLRDVVAAFGEAFPDALLLNCAGIEALDAPVEALRQAWDGPWGVYPNACVGDAADWGRRAGDAELAQAAKRWLEVGASVLGGCCFTTSETVRRLAAVAGSEAG